MADRPIPFSAPMVAALRAGSKSQTRRAITPRGRVSLFDGSWSDGYVLDPGNQAWRDREIGVVKGDRLWVRESYFQFGHWAPIAGAQTKGGRQKWGFTADRPEILFDAPAQYRKGMHSADPATPAWHKRLGRFMPRSASRMTLLVTEVRVQRLQDCSEEDAIAEGIERAPWRSDKWLNYLHPSGAFIDPVKSYSSLWDSINGAGAWEANPWVVAYSFSVSHRNVDAPARQPVSEEA